MLAEMSTPKLIPRRVATSLDELLVDATDRRPFLHTDSKSGVNFERVTIDGEPHVLKHVHIDDDWTMRFFHESSCVPLDVWRAGLMDVLPGRIDHGMVGAAGGQGRDGLGAALLMHDLSDALVPAGDDLLPMATHLELLDGLAALSACMWGWHDTVGLLPLANRWLFFGDADIDDERRRGWPNPVPKIAGAGWVRFFERAPRDLRLMLRDLRADTRPLVDAVATTPLTFGWDKDRLVPNRSADTSLFTDEELAAVDKTLDELRELNSSQVSALSHREPGWLVTDLNENDRPNPGVPTPHGPAAPDAVSSPADCRPARTALATSRMRAWREVIVSEDCVRRAQEHFPPGSSVDGKSSWELFEAGPLEALKLGFSRGWDTATLADAAGIRVQIMHGLPGLSSDRGLRRTCRWAAQGMGGDRRHS